MPDLVKFTIDNGEEIFIQAMPVPVAEGEAGSETEETSSFDRAADRTTTTIEKSTRHFERSLQSVKPVANALMDMLTGLVTKPDEVNVEFSIALGTEGSLVIASASVEANFKIALTWHKD